MFLRTALAAAAVVLSVAGATTASLADQDRPDGVRTLEMLEPAAAPATPLCADPAPVQITFSGGTVHVPNHGEVPALIVQGTVTNDGPAAVSSSARTHEARLRVHWGDDDPIEVASLSLAGLGVGEVQTLSGAVVEDAYRWLYARHGAPLFTLWIDAAEADCGPAGSANTTADYGPAPSAM